MRFKITYIPIADLFEHIYLTTSISILNKQISYYHFLVFKQWSCPCLLTKQTGVYFRRGGCQRGQRYHQFGTFIYFECYMAYVYIASFSHMCMLRECNRQNTHVSRTYLYSSCHISGLSVSVNSAKCKYDKNKQVIKYRGAQSTI